MNITKIFIEITIFITVNKNHKINSIFYKFKDFGLSELYKSQESIINNSYYDYLSMSYEDRKLLLKRRLLFHLGITKCSDNGILIEDITIDENKKINRTDFDVSKYFINCHNPKLVYKQLMSQYHPDNFHSLDNEFVELANNRAKLINDYYDRYYRH